ncbi:CIC11C00000004487 [Sungouiella intermedia]|uniref:CIC11C00000003271 n=1 Tax=Sungouiella intermedia TaxID=45354 RepID=A0A1L0DJY0_9ASCO|nr:CIC11C00000004487 [[Candida] intermedia]SGZ57562.1 CIC11C00000003271 [[Candida] intermedia]
MAPFFRSQESDDFKSTSLGDDHYVINLDDSDFVEHEDNKLELKRGLKDRHISLLALAGIIGPGILVGAALPVSNGPLSLILGFGIIGLIAFSMIQSLGELATLYPLGSVFSTLGNRLFDRALGGTVGWNYAIIWIAVLANEYNTVAAIMRFWGPQVPLYGYVLIFWGAFLAFQFLGVATFGEAEYWLALMKIVGILAFYIFSIVYVSGGIKGQKAFGFHYWNDPGMLANGFKSVVSTFVFASTFYSGTESVAIAASETRNPSKAIPTAVRQTFIRILFIYMGLALFYGLTVPYNSDDLTEGNKTLKSPMTVAIKNAGWEGGAHLINAFILLTCVSAINSSIYIGSRTIVHLANEGSAPRFLNKVNKQGVPYLAVILFNAFGLLSLMNISTGAANAYQYIVNLSGVAVFIVWGAINVYHIRFRQAWRFHGRSVSSLPYKGLWYPYLPIFGIVINVFLALIQGWSTFKPFSAKDFVDAYILLPFFFVLFGFLKLVNRTKWIRLEEIDLDEGRRKDLDPH